MKKIVDILKKNDIEEIMLVPKWFLEDGKKQEDEIDVLFRKGYWEHENKKVRYGDIESVDEVFDYMVKNDFLSIRFVNNKYEFWGCGKRVMAA